MKSSDIDNAHVVQLAARWWNDPQNSPGVVAALVAEGVPEKLARSKVSSLISKGLLEAGVSENYAWPTNRSDDLDIGH